MFDGKMFFGLTGTPMRNTVFANMVFALADPEPFTVANLQTKSLTPLMCNTLRVSADVGIVVDEARLRGLRLDEEELLHVPGAGRTALRAQPAVQTQIFVLGHDTSRLENVRDVQILRCVMCRHPQPLAELA